ncbi:MAG: hypothetical protein ABIB47_03935 [Candidatus Woesearchaeota archaeon]
MKKAVIILLVFVLVLQVFATEMTLEVGQVQEFEGYDIKLKNLKIDKAVISVNGESAIFEIEEEETILGVNIKLNEILYIGESEGNVKIDISALYVCGDGNCDGPETKESCCQDCGCNSGYDCVDGECLVHVEDECDTDSDCDDSDEDTLDKCIGSRPKTCKNYAMTVCIDNSDCDDGRACTTDECRNNDCFNEKIQNCIDGGEGEIVGIEFLEENLKKDVVGLEEEEGKEKVSLIKRLWRFFKGIFFKDS